MHAMPSKKWTITSWTEEGLSSRRRELLKGDPGRVGRGRTINALNAEERVIGKERGTNRKGE